MNIRIAAAGAALFAGMTIGTPAWAICLPLWGTVCRPGASPAAEPAASETATPQKPLNLRKVAHKGTRHTHVAARRHRPEAVKQASRTTRTHAHDTAIRRFAAAKRRHNVEARREAPPKEVKTPVALREETAQVAAAASSATASGASAQPQTDGYVPSQNEVTDLDLAADKPQGTSPQGTTTPPTAAPNPALWNAVAPTDAAANTGVEAPAEGTKTVHVTNVVAAPTAPTEGKGAASTDGKGGAPTDRVASADASKAPEVSTPAPQQPTDEPSWLRRIVIGLGGVLTLASAVRLFVG